MGSLALLLILAAFSPVQPQGVWSGWGDWSACSRTCGGGITYQERTCLDKPCSGSNRNINTCNIQDCPNGVQDFRTEQCAKFNSVPLDSQTYNWVPYYGGIGDNKCALNCMPKYERFARTLQEKVIDGTRCDKSTYDMCVDGTCMKAGCDLIIGSDAKEDKCRICNGGGANCKTIEAVYTAKQRRRGYVDILTIPVGASNILIEDNTANHLALKNATFAFILNGRLTFEWFKEMKEAGTTITYEKSTRKSEKIFALGPTTNILYVVLFVRRRLKSEVSVSYEFSVPKSQIIEDHKITYSWKIDDYSECSKTCSGGKKTRRIYCVRSSDDVEMKKNYCNATTKPQRSSSCNTEPCAPRWFIDTWGPCSKTCGEGMQVRRVHCEQETVDGFIIIDDDQCPGEKVNIQQQCVEEEQCPRWSLGEWSQCSTTCGGGIRKRLVTCVENSSNSIYDDDKCPDHDKPRGMEPCGETPCEVVWVVGEWGECFPKCGEGMRTRYVYCGSSTESSRRYQDDMCDITSKPSQTKNCSNVQRCPPMWYGSSWSKCTARCGRGMQMRNVFCGVKRERADILHILPEVQCAGLPRLEKTQSCKDKPCHTQWVTSPWKECSSTCGGGKRLREVKCLSDSEEDKTGKSCDADEKPPIEDYCNTFDCNTDTNKINNQKTTEIPPTTQPSVTQVTTRLPQGPRIPTTTEGLTTEGLTTEGLTTEGLTIEGLTTESLTTEGLTTEGPTTEGLITESLTTEGLTTEGLTTQGPTTQGPTTTEGLTTQNPTTQGRRRPVVVVVRPTRPVITVVRPTRRATNNNGGDVSGKSMPAEILRGPRERIEAVVGDDITLSCRTTGNPKPDIFWMKGNLDVSIFGRRFETFPDGSLTIHTVQQVDSHKYKCVATNGIEIRTSRPAELIVTTPPYVDITFGYTVKKGNEAVIECTVSGKPKPTVQWFKGDKELAVGNSDGGNVIVTEDKVTIKKATPQDQGKYRCKARNKNGERSAMMMLDVLGDKKTRMDEMMNGDCYDMPEFANCARLGSVDGFCKMSYFQKICCKTCRDKLLKKVNT